MAKRTTSKPTKARRTRRSGNNPKPPGDSPRAGAGTAAESAGATAFAFSVAQLKYLIALREAADEGRPTSDRALSEELKMSRTTIWEWKHDAAFKVWLREELKTESDADFELAVARHTRLAIKGSVRSFEAIARLRAVGLKVSVDQGDAVDNSIANYSVNLLCPRPPALRETS